MTQTDTAPDTVGSCWECGYALRGLESRRCPECGRPFDPADETSTNRGHTIGPLVRWLMSPPGWPTYLLLAAAVLASVWACVVPTRRGAFVDEFSILLQVPPRLWARRLGGVWADAAAPHGRFVLGAILWLLLALVWIARRAARGVAVRRVSKQKAATFAYWRRWLIVPTVFALTVCACETRLPTYAGFWVSKPWLDRAAREAQASPPHYLPPRTLGAFTRYPFGPGVGRGKAWAQTIYENGRAEILIGYSTALVRQDDGRPPTDPIWSATPPLRIRRLSSNWFLVEPDRASD
jgi:hypothetical protein